VPPASFIFFRRSEAEPPVNPEDRLTDSPMHTDRVIASVCADGVGGSSTQTCSVRWRPM
jgi:hypothetical protein